MNAAESFFGQPEFQRGRYGWAVIDLPDGGTDLYRRASSMSNHLDDKQGLIDWSAAMVAKGMSKDQALLANFAVLDWKEDKPKVKEMLGKAKDLGGGSAAADMGTAFHAVVEKHLQGRPITPSDLPPGFQDSLNATIAYLRDTGFEVVGTEVRVVDDHYRIAGTADLILRATRDIETPYGTIRAGAIIIADLKTGSVSDYSGLGMSMQLGIYAHARPYDVTTGARISWPGGDTPEEIGLILKVDLAAGTVEPWWLDLAGGYANVEHAFTIQEVRKNARRLIAKDKSGDARTPAHANHEAQERKLGAREVGKLITAATSREEMLAIKAEHGDVFTEKMNARFDVVLEERFPEVSDDPTDYDEDEEPELAAAAAKKRAANEGSTFAELKAKKEALDAIVEDPWESTGNAQVEDQAPAPKEKTRAEQIAEEAAGLANVGEARECYKKWRRAGAPAEEIKVILERATALGATMKGQ